MPLSAKQVPRASSGYHINVLYICRMQRVVHIRGNE